MTKQKWIAEIEILLKKDKSSNVNWLSYEHDKDTGEEYVHIHFENGYHKLVNVTANSNAAILIEVTRAVYY